MPLFSKAIRYGGCSSVGRASDCGSECRGFESRHPPHKPLRRKGRSVRSGPLLLEPARLGCSQVVRHGTLTPAFAGSSPAIPANAGIAQMAERCFRTAQAFGSIPNSSSIALLVMLTFVWLVHHSTAISVRDTTGYTRYSTDVGLAAIMRRGGIYVDVA